MCIPTSNKEGDNGMYFFYKNIYCTCFLINLKPFAHFFDCLSLPETTSSSNTNAGLECINVITNALGPRSVSLREMMRRATAAASRSGLERELGSGSGVDQPPVAPLHEEPIPTLSWPPESFDPTSGDEDSLMGLGASASAKGVTSSVVQGNGTLVIDPTERRNNAIQALQAMCDAPVLTPYLKELLSAK